MTKEDILNQYYNIRHLNTPKRIGCMMEMIRNLRPLTKEEWKYWYLKNVHDEKYLLALAEEMYQSIPESDRKTFQITYQKGYSYCRDYLPGGIPTSRYYRDPKGDRIDDPNMIERLDALFSDRIEKEKGIQEPNEEPNDLLTLRNRLFGIKTDA